MIDDRIESMINEKQTKKLPEKLRWQFRLATGKLLRIYSPYPVRVETWDYEELPDGTVKEERLTDERGDWPGAIRNT